ncbi:uncharacterized protein V1513DRAFT_477496 [Lipomyces chichibuensis]|uniref:uncharacterized protein n=1 Tax=Lipomyces chichibuensis TaxID=1546026 RepID=UPI00334407FF
MPNLCLSFPQNAVKFQLIKDWTNLRAYYATDPNAVLNDTDVVWRHADRPNYSNTRKAFEETNQMSHEPGSLEAIVQKLVRNWVRNWEIEASFNSSLTDWLTVDPNKYPQPAEHMLKSIALPTTTLNHSHKTIKRMMPTFCQRAEGQIKAHGGPLAIKGVTIATVNSELKVEKLETWFDLLTMLNKFERRRSSH